MPLPFEIVPENTHSKELEILICRKLALVVPEECAIITVVLRGRNSVGMAPRENVDDEGVPKPLPPTIVTHFVTGSLVSCNVADAVPQEIAMLPVSNGVWYGTHDPPVPEWYHSSPKSVRWA